MFEHLAVNRAEADRLCLPGLGERAERELVHEAQVRIVEHMRGGEGCAAVARMRRHLARLDLVIDKVHERHRDYFSGDCHT